MAFSNSKSLLGSVTLATAIAACDADSLTTLDPASNDTSSEAPNDAFTFGFKSGTATHTFTPFITSSFLPSGSGELGGYAYCFDAARNYPANVPLGTVTVAS